MKTTKQAILAKANELFEERGFENVTVDDICASLGITKGSYYHHYRSKYEPLLDHAREAFVKPELFAEKFAQIQSPRERLFAIYRWGYYDMYEELSREDFRRTWLINIEAGSRGISFSFFMDNPQLSAEILRTIQEIQEQNLTANRSDPENILHTLVSAATGYAINWVMSGDTILFPEGLRKVFDTILF